MPPSDNAAHSTPLAPSVEKAYYRKCIELKRRLNEVEAANDEMKTKRVRLDRAIMKMRLERAFLLEQLSRRMEVNVDGSEGSGDEGLATGGKTREPPPERPHRDKRRRHERPLAPQQGSSAHSQGPMTQPQQMQSPSQVMQAPTHAQPAPPPYPATGLQRLPSYPTQGDPADIRSLGEMMPANAVTSDGRPVYVPPHQLAAVPPPIAMQTVPPSAGYGGSPYGAPVGIPGATQHAANGHHGFDGATDKREAGRGGGGGRPEHLGGGAGMREEESSERRMTGEGQGHAGRGLEMERAEAGDGQGGGGFSAINK
ncbi:hypothetical protein LTR53_016874 [Teratosphaeriaceae sp. CCFEE 6253]|nr:hypothetical protein LTR53_016874 [Teratosphaeriaceae sp. CCFEE 6253]